MTDLFKLNWKDAVKGLVTAVLASVVVYVQQSLTSNAPVDWHQVLLIAEGAGVGYLVKNFFTDSNGKLLGAI